MGRKVHTRDIMEMLDIPSAPITADTILELEQTIEKRWLKAFEDQRLQMEESFRKRNSFEKAKSRIAEAVLSQLHILGVDIPTLYSAAAMQNGEPEDEVIVQLIDTALHHIIEGFKFEVLKKAVMENVTLLSEWERFCMFLRLASEE